MNEGLVRQVAIKLWLDFLEVLDGISLARVYISIFYVCTSSFECAIVILNAIIVVMVIF